MVTLWFFVIICSISVYSANADLFDDAYKYHTNSQWYIGMGLSQGDVLDYHICDYVFGTESNLFPHCYDITIHVLKQDNDSFLIYADINSGTNISQSSLFRLSTNGIIKSLELKDQMYARSLQNTIFDLSKFATHSSPKQLKLGSFFGITHSPIGDSVLVVNKIIQNYNSNNKFYQIEIDLSNRTIFWVDKNTPFPIHAIAYDPYYTMSKNPLYKYTLLNYNQFINSKTSFDQIYLPTFSLSNIDDVYLNSLGLDKKYNSTYTSINDKKILYSDHLIED